MKLVLTSLCAAVVFMVWFLAALLKDGERKK